MKLVDYLRALLSRFYSKTTADKAEISGLSAIDVKNSVVIANGSVSPKDGYVVVDSEAVGTSSHATYIYQDLHLINGFRCAIPSGYTYSTFAPVKKGSVILVDIADAEVKQVKVYGLVGGGNSILNPILRSIQGGLLCLRNTCKLYLKRLSVVRKSWSAICRHLLRHTSMCQDLKRMARCCTTHQHKTGFFTCGFLTIIQKLSSCDAREQTLGRLWEGIHITAFRSGLGRESLSRLWLAQIAGKKLRSIRSFSYQTKPISSLSFGGALC